MIGLAILGFVLGAVSAHIFLKFRRRGPVGTLVLRRSEPDEAPYFFLELTNGGWEAVMKQSTVEFRVDRN